MKPSNKEITPNKQPDFSAFENHYSLEGFKLTKVRAVFLPISQYNVTVKVEKNIPANRFTLILLKLVNAGFTTRTAICDQLGIKKDDFTLLQLNHSLHQNFLNEYAPECYQITAEGSRLLQDESPIREVVESSFEVHFCQKLKKWLDIKKPIDVVSASLNAGFNGYRLINENERKRLVETVKKWEIGEKALKPESDSIQAKTGLPTNEDIFCQFAHELYPGNLVYEVVKWKKESEIKHIPFLAFEYINEHIERKIDIRRYKSDIKKSSDFEFEYTLTKTMMV